MNRLPTVRETVTADAALANELDVLADDLHALHERWRRLSKIAAVMQGDATPHAARRLAHGLTAFQASVTDR